MKRNTAQHLPASAQLTNAFPAGGNDGLADAAGLALPARSIRVFSIH